MGFTTAMKQTTNKILPLLISVAVLFTVISCSKDSLSFDRGVYITSDTLFFDTVFTGAGSVTRSFKIINGNSSKA